MWFEPGSGCSVLKTSNEHVQDVLGTWVTCACKALIPPFAHNESALTLTNTYMTVLHDKQAWQS